MEQLALPAPRCLHTVRHAPTEVFVAHAPQDTLETVVKLAFRDTTSIAVPALSALPSVPTAWSVPAQTYAHPARQAQVDPPVSTASLDTTLTLITMEPVLPAVTSAPCVYSVVIMILAQYAKRATLGLIAVLVWLGTTTTEAHASSARRLVLYATNVHPTLVVCFAHRATQALTAAPASLATITTAMSVLPALILSLSVNLAPLEVPVSSALPAIQEQLAAIAH